MQATANRIDTVTRSVEKIVQGLANSVDDLEPDRRRAVALLRRTVTQNAELYGSGIGYEPAIYGSRAPYVYQPSGVYGTAQSPEMKAATDLVVTDLGRGGRAYEIGGLVPAAGADAPRGVDRAGGQRLASRCAGTAGRRVRSRRPPRRSTRGSGNLRAPPPGPFGRRQRPVDIDERAGQEADVVPDVLRRRIDFMRDACRQLTDSLQLLCLNELTLHRRQLADTQLETLLRGRQFRHASVQPSMTLFQFARARVDEALQEAALRLLLPLPTVSFRDSARARPLQEQHRRV